MGDLEDRPDPIPDRDPDDDETPETPPTEPPPVPVQEPPMAPGQEGPYVVAGWERRCALESGGVLWTEYARNAVGLPQCLPKNSARLPARAVAPRMRRGPHTSGRLTKHARQAVKVVRSAAEAVVVLFPQRPRMGLLSIGLPGPAWSPAGRTSV